MKWTECYSIDSHNCDLNGNARAAMLLRYMQDTANRQMRRFGPSNEELRERGLAFILSRINLRFYMPLHAYDEIEVSTWGCESRGVSFNRCYRICRGDKIAAEAVSVWGLLGIEDRRILRVSDIELGFGTDEPIELDLPGRVRIPRELELPVIGERPIVYSDLDANRHMNNTNYPDMLCDFVPGMEKKRVAALSISFVGEARLGEVLKIQMAESAGQSYFRTIRADGSVNVEAIMALENL